MGNEEQVYSSDYDSNNLNSDEDNPINKLDTDEIERIIPSKF